MRRRGGFLRIRRSKPRGHARRPEVYDTGAVGLPISRAYFSDSVLRFSDKYTVFRANPGFKNTKDGLIRVRFKRFGSE